MNTSVFSTFPSLETERLVMRAVGVEDIPMVFAFNSDPETIRFVPRALYESMDEALEKVAGFTSGFRQEKGIWWTFVLKETGTAIGYGGLFDIDAECSKAEIGYGALEEFWGKGLIGEATAAMTEFGKEVMELHRIYGHVDPANEPSAKILLKLGFKKEGCLRHDIFARGQYFDMDVFGLVD
jgi:[ribosomal protein S5]-alanine N-acetyltransferase